MPSQLPSSSELSDYQDLPPRRLATRRKGGGMYSILPQRGVTCNYPFMSECMLEVPTTCLSMLGHHCLLCIYGLECACAFIAAIMATVLDSFNHICLCTIDKRIRILLSKVVILVV